jgi:hypothetical protein
MDILERIQWFINFDPKTAIIKQTNKKLSKNELNTFIFESNSDSKTVKLSFPLNDNYLFFVTREISLPVTVKQLLTCIYNFYKESLLHEHIDNAFNEMEDWKNDIVDYYDGDSSKLTNFDVFTDSCEPDFCGLQYDETTDSYTVHIGPE